LPRRGVGRRGAIRRQRASSRRGRDMAGPYQVVRSRTSSLIESFETRSNF
jgi:hypothetical protein